MLGRGDMMIFDGVWRVRLRLLVGVLGLGLELGLKGEMMRYKDRGRDGMRVLWIGYGGRFDVSIYVRYDSSEVEQLYMNAL